MRFTGKTAFITGGGVYIGFYTAMRLALEGADIVICDINKTVIDEAVEKIMQAGVRVTGIAADVSEPREVEDAGLCKGRDNSIL